VFSYLNDIPLTASSTRWTWSEKWRIHPFDTTSELWQSSTAHLHRPS